MLQGEHSAILSTFIKLPFANNIFVLTIFEWPLKTGFTEVLFLQLNSLEMYKTRNLCKLAHVSYHVHVCRFTPLRDFPRGTKSPTKFASSGANFKLPTGQIWHCNFSETAAASAPPYNPGSEVEHEKSCITSGPGLLFCERRKI